MSISECTYPKCQATSGCAGACSKTSPTAWAEITKEYVAVSDEPFENATPLYTAPVQEDWYGQHQWQCGYERGWDAAMEQKREWVGLTVEEIDDIWKTEVFDVHYGIARMVEAKLKEKNCG
jgi:hypothetical protein